MFHFAHTTVYYTQVVCYHAQSVWEKGGKVAIYLSGINELPH